MDTDSLKPPLSYQKALLRSLEMGFNSAISARLINARLGSKVSGKPRCAKQKYAGVLQEPARDDYLRRSKFLVDLSLRHNSGQYNRIVQEAMAQGCVVIADPRFITSTSRLFIPAKHYIPINAELTGEALAWELQQLEREYGTHRYPHMQAAARKLLKAFDRKALGERITEVAIWASQPDDINIAPDRAKLKRGRDEFQRIFGGRP
jgi:hypothetical protein